MNNSELLSYYKSKEFQSQDYVNSQNLLQQIIANNINGLSEVDQYNFNGSIHYSNPHNYISTEAYNEEVLRNREKYKRYAKMRDDEYLKQFTRYSQYITTDYDDVLIDNREAQQEFINRNYDSNNPALTQGHSIIASTKALFNDEINESNEIAKNTIYYTNPN